VHMFGGGNSRAGGPHIRYLHNGRSGPDDPAGGSWGPPESQGFLSLRGPLAASPLGALRSSTSWWLCLFPIPHPLRSPTPGASLDPSRITALLRTVLGQLLALDHAFKLYCRGVGNGRKTVSVDDDWPQRSQASLLKESSGNLIYIATADAAPAP
jgi:hypothetical protein